MPTTAVVPADAASREGERLVHAAFGPGAGAQLQIVVPAGRELERATTVVARDPGIAAVVPVERSGDRALITAVPTSAPGSAGLRATLDRLRRTLPPKALVGGAAAENRDVERALLSRLPLVVGLVVAIGFALLTVVLRSAVAAAATVAMNLLASAAAFGVARLVFQDGALAGPLGFESQGFVDAWAPIFFSALLFALAMDYSIFLLSAVREHRRRGETARAATVEALAETGRIINAAAALMIGVFASFASPARCRSRRWASSSPSACSSTPCSSAWCCSRSSCACSMPAAVDRRRTTSPPGLLHLQPPFPWTCARNAPPRLSLSAYRKAPERSASCSSTRSINSVSSRHRPSMPTTTRRSLARTDNDHSAHRTLARGAKRQLW